MTGIKPVIDNRFMKSAFKRPESVLIIIYTTDQQVLLMQRLHPDNFWQSVTGSIEDGETPPQTAKRELLEETGLKNVKLEYTGIQNIYPIHPAWRYRYHEDIHFNKEYVFVCCLDSVCDIQFNPGEHTEYRWLNKSKALDLCSSVTNRRAIAMLV